MRSTLALLVACIFLAAIPEARGADDEDCAALIDANRKIICEYDRKQKQRVSEWNAALAEVNQAIAAKSDDASSYLRRAELYGHLGETEKEIADLTRAAELAPEDYRPYYNRALAYEYSEQYDLALADYDKLMSLRPGDEYFKTRRAATVSKAAAASEPPEAKPQPEAAAAPSPADEDASAPGASGQNECRRFDALINEIVAVPCPN